MLKKLILAAGLAIAAAYAAPAMSAPISGAAVPVAGNSVEQVQYWDHSRWRSHRRWGSGHNRWRSHRRWGSRDDGHNRWRSHRRWGSRDDGHSRRRSHRRWGSRY